MSSADNLCYICGEVMFSSQKCAVILIIRKTYHPLLWMPVWGPGQELGPTHMLQYLGSKPSKVVDPQKAINAFCHTHGVERADESYQ
jgi:hypothetical protein